MPVVLETAEAALHGANRTPDGEHPAVQAAQAQLASAQAKLVLAQTDQRDPMELGLGITQERSAFGVGADTTLRFALRIPLGGEHRNGPRVAAARADLDVAQAEADAATRQVQADTAIASLALATARRSEALAAVRARLSGEVHALITRSYQLGEGDLPTRLRAENDKFDADLSVARARIDVQRAASQLNQALGLLP
jgi:cobalt-zinc-cadmium efflux system outer membrane protein